MYIAGAGLARGYLNRPDLDAARFAPVPGVPGEDRLYRSGDRAVRLPDGDLVYLGRTDDQLKIRGYRIEPGEVEECLARLEGIARAIVTSRDFGDGDIRLAAYLVPARATRHGRQPDAQIVAAAERHARSALPRYLRPAVYKVVSDIPMTPQGKVDRDALGM
jgi:acyl-coenzyme A synthetase/AMP-(fatty) acid ligase